MAIYGFLLALLERIPAPAFLSIFSKSNRARGQFVKSCMGNSTIIRFEFANKCVNPINNHPVANARR